MQCTLFTYLFFLIWALPNTNFAQGIAINETGITADPSAIADFNAAKKGLLIPRLTTEGRNQIVSPAKALVIFNISTNNFEVNTGTPNQPTWDGLVSYASLKNQLGPFWRDSANIIDTEIEVIGSNNGKGMGLATRNFIRLYIDSTSGHIGINTIAPQASLHINSNGAIILPTGNTAQRPVTPVPGMIRFNTETGKLEGYTTLGWKAFQ